MTMETIKNKFNISEMIRSIKEAREELRRAACAENSLCSPMLTDYSLIPELYKIFCEERGGLKPGDDRKVFIFIIQYLYAPRNLFGCRMPSGLRTALSNVMGIRSHSVLTRSASETLHNYRIYSSFREEVNSIFSKMMERVDQIQKQTEA